ncbi:MAG: rRNA pseudouridine synthase [Lachnospiraceae bacterium]|nr:rRNA pseudouridine synthase [Lachnospiraceae bacterium]
MRLNKFIAAAGTCSRRDADKLIKAGKVTVNEIAAVMGMEISPSDVVTVGGKKLSQQEEKIVLAFYKPIGVTCTEKDRFAKKIVKDVLHYPVRLTYSGRLDKDSEGLLLMTNDGDLISKMMGGAEGNEKEYEVKVDKEITADMIAKLSGGIYLPELKIKTKPCRIKQLGKYTFTIILTQGVNRQIRRMCEVCGYRVKKLKRTRIINIGLANLKPGEHRRILHDELKALYQSVGMGHNLAGKVSLCQPQHIVK